MTSNTFVMLRVAIEKHGVAGKQFSQWECDADERDAARGMQTVATRKEEFCQGTCV